MSIFGRRKREPRDDVAERCRCVARVLIGWTVLGDGTESVSSLLYEAADRIDELVVTLPEERP